MIIDHITANANFKGYPVKIRGQIYPSAAAAGRALGVNAVSVLEAIKRGTQDNIGNGPGSGTRRKVEHNGIEYESVTAFANKFGLDRIPIYRRICTANKRGRNAITTPVGDLKIRIEAQS